MTNSRTDNGRGLFYTRDSGGKHEQTPAQYVEWAMRKARELGVTFDGTGARINNMMETGSAVEGDLFFDFGVQGNQSSRPALDKLREVARHNLSVSHLFIPRRDRLFRPDDPIEGVHLEDEFRRNGITLVFMDRTLPPSAKRARRDMAETIVAVMEYDQSGKFRADLAEKMIFAQLKLAKSGFSTGGRAPYGFHRVLIRADGAIVRELADREVVRQPGHHVVWLPGPQEQLDLTFRILHMLELMPANQVAGLLTAESIPSPDAGRVRKDNGVRHTVSGVWHQNTVTNIARNPLLLAVVTYGRRSMGDQRRIGTYGPRELIDSDLHEAEDKLTPKVIRNPSEIQIQVAARFEPLDVDRHTRLLADLSKRGETQRGKSRSRDPNKNPLGGRIYDLNCTFPMYRTPTKNSFRYVCAYYQQTHGQKCAHNHIDGIAATKFLLSAIRQRLLSAEALQRLQSRLRDKARAEHTRTDGLEALNLKREELRRISTDLALVQENMARAASQKQYESISSTFEKLKAEENSKAIEIADLEKRTPTKNSIEDEVAAAMSCLSTLPALAADAGNLPAVTALFKRMNVQLYLRFQPQRKVKRVENRMVGGILTCGDVTSPIEKYRGPTSRQSLKSNAVADDSATIHKHAAVGGINVVVTEGEEESLGNVSRGDRS